MLRRKHGDSATLDLWLCLQRWVEMSRCFEFHWFPLFPLPSSMCTGKWDQTSQTKKNISTNPIITIKPSQNLSRHLVTEDPYPTARHRKIFQLQLESLEGLVLCFTLHTLHATSIKSHRSTSYYLHIIIFVVLCMYMYVYMVEEEPL